MKVILKMILFFLCFWMGQGDLLAQSKESKSSINLDSTDIVKIKEFFSDLDVDRVTMLKIKQLIPDLDTVKMNKIRGWIPHIKYYDNKTLEMTRKSLEPDSVPKNRSQIITWSPKKDTVIVQGSDVHWRFKFSTAITYVELQGVGCASRKEIKAGEWHITTKPKKTTTYHIFFKNRELNGLYRSGYKVNVVVVESESEVKKAWDELKKKREETLKNREFKISYSNKNIEKR